MTSLTYGQGMQPAGGVTFVAAAGSAATIQSVAVGSAGTTVTYTYDISVSHATGVPTLSEACCSSPNLTLTYSSGDGTTAIVYSVNRTINPGEVMTSSGAAGIVKNGGTNNNAFSGTSVTNSSTASDTEETAGNLVSSTWTGSDIFNTDGGTGHVWTGAGVNLPNAVFAIDATGKGWMGEKNSAKLSGTFAATQYYLNFTSLTLGEVAVRFFIRPTTLGIASAAEVPLIRYYASSTNLAQVKLYNSSGTYQLRFTYTDTQPSIQTDTYNLPDQTLATGYQIELLFKKNTGGSLAYAKVWSEDGGTLLHTATTVSTMSNTDVTEIRFGYQTGAGSTANTVYLDIVKMSGGASQSMLGPRTP